MSDRPLGIDDLHTVLMNDLTEPDYWTWCRRHERAEHASEPIYAVRCPKCDRRIAGKSGPLTQPGEFVGACGHTFTVTDVETQTCIRIGPFMSEREANRLSDDGTGAMGYTHDCPLGMEVER